MAYLMALVVTLLIEGAVAFLLGFRSVRDQFRIALVNCITHPLFHGILLLIGVARWQGMPDIMVILLVLEVLISAAEWFFFLWLYPKKGTLFLLLTSLCMNTASVAVGLCLF